VLLLEYQHLSLDAPTSLETVAAQVGVARVDASSALGHPPGFIEEH
jgi:hypothetical protein